MEKDPFPESEHIRKILEAFYHSVHDYNKWTSTRDKKKTFSYEEAKNALVKYGKTIFK